MTIHLERPTRPGQPRVTLWDADWETAVARGRPRDGLDPAANAILPAAVVGLARLPHAGRPMSLYERAVEFEEQRRFDEALDHYYKALRKDPMNLALRLQIGYLQERLALFMDALATYEGILAMAGPGRQSRGPTSLPENGRRKWARSKPDRRDHQRRYYRAAERRNRHWVVLTTRYRRAILLGGADLPRQWCKPSRGVAPAREAERETLRVRLAPPLRRVFEQAPESKQVEWVTRGGGLRRSLLARARERLARRPRPVPRLGQTAPADVLDQAHERELEELCVLSSIHELAELRAQLPHVGRTKDVPLTRAVLDLSGLCLIQRLERVQGNLTCKPLEEPNVRRLCRAIRRIEGPREFRRWQEHYNAACVLALPLLTDHGVLRSTQARRLASAAVMRLERAIACADSGFVASRRDWLLSDDPDLDGLRTKEDFKQFEAIYFPSALGSRKRPQGLHAWELSRYTLELVSETSDRFVQAWRSRKTGLEPEIEVRALADWCDVEMEAWGLVGDVTLNHQHWQTRVKLIAFVRQLSTRADFEVPAVSFPRFTELEGAMAEHIDEWVRGNNDRLAALSELVRQGREKAGDTPLIEDLSLTRVALGRIDGTGSKLRQADVAELCEAHAAVWQAFGKCVTDRGEDPAIVLQAIETLICRWEAIKLGFAGWARWRRRRSGRWRAGVPGWPRAGSRSEGTGGRHRRLAATGHGRPTPTPTPTPRI